MGSMAVPTSLKACKCHTHSTLVVASNHLCSVNVIEGEPNDRQMTTGNHTVRDIYCCKCGTTLGWKYVRLPFVSALICTESELLPV